MEELLDSIYENLETDDEHNEFNRRAFRLMEILSNKGLSLSDQVRMNFNEMSFLFYSKLMC
jgi:hypothetical protein